MSGSISEKQNFDDLEYHEIISCSWDDSKLILISTMIKEKWMSQLGVNEKDLGIKEAGLPCLTVFSRDVLVLLRT